MSKIFTKLQTTPYYVTKEFAEKLNLHFLNRSLKDNDLIEVLHALGKKILVFNDIRGIDITNDDDYKSKRRETSSNSENQPQKQSPFESWTDLKSKDQRATAPEIKASQKNFSKLVWNLFMKTTYPDSEIYERVVNFFRRNPNRTLADVDVILGTEDKQITKHNPAEISALNIVYTQLKNDRYYF